MDSWVVKGGLCMLCLAIPSFVGAIVRQWMLTKWLLNGLMLLLQCIMPCCLLLFSIEICVSPFFVAIFCPWGMCFTISCKTIYTLTFDGKYTVYEHPFNSHQSNWMWYKTNAWIATLRRETNWTSASITSTSSHHCIPIPQFYQILTRHSDFNLYWKRMA